jgi:hypothetical protein
MVVLTPEQETIAMAEGWRIRAGQPQRCYDMTGHTPFDSTFKLYEHLDARGRDVEWIREVFVALPWGAAHDAIAQKDGWKLEHDYIRTTDRTRYADNDAASAHVLEGLAVGVPICIKAAKTVAFRKLANAQRNSPWHQ